MPPGQPCHEDDPHGEAGLELQHRGDKPADQRHQGVLSTEAQRDRPGDATDGFEVLDLQREPHPQHGGRESPEDPRFVEPEHRLRPKKSHDREADEPDRVEIVEPGEEGFHGDNRMDRRKMTRAGESSPP